MKWSKEKSVCVQSLVGAAPGFDNLLLQKIFLQENLSIRLTFFLQRKVFALLSRKKVFHF